MSLEHWRRCYDACRDDDLFRHDSTWGSVSALREYICHGYIKHLERALKEKPNFNQTTRLHVEYYGKMYGEIKPEIERDVLNLREDWPAHWGKLFRLPTSVSAHRFHIMRVYINYLEMEVKYSYSETEFYPDGSPEEIDIYPEMDWHA